MKRNYYLNEGRKETRIARELLKVAKMLAAGDGDEEVEKIESEMGDKSDAAALLKEFENGLNQVKNQADNFGDAVENSLEDIVEEEGGNKASVARRHSFTASRKRLAAEARIANLKADYAEFIASINDIVACVRQLRVASRRRRDAGFWNMDIFKKKQDEVMETKEVGKNINNLGAVIHNFAKITGKVLAGLALLPIGVVIWSMDKLWKGVKWLGEELAKIPGLAQKAVDDFIEKVSQFIQSMIDEGKELWSAIKKKKAEIEQAVGEEKDRLVKELQDLYHKIGDTISGWSGKATGWILKQGQSFIHGITTGEYV